MDLVHLHARYAAVDSPVACPTECGLPCGTSATTAYRDLDPERVTCQTCKEALR